MQIETLPQLRKTYLNARRAMILRCVDDGLTQIETARKLNVRRAWLQQIAKAEGIEWKAKYIRPQRGAST